MMNTASKRIVGALSDALPNLDAIQTPEEAEQLRATFKQLSKDLIELASYCEATKHAQQCRLAGKTGFAMKFEDARDQVYNRLPEWARW